MLDWADSFTIQMPHGDGEFFQSVGALVRYCVILARDVFYHLDCLPWMLARLDLPGVAARCRERFAAVPAASHHQLTRDFMDPETEDNLADHVNDVDDDGHGISPVLRDAISKMQNTPQDDIVQEEPHSRAAKTVARSTNHGFPWLAASSRLVPTLTDLEELPSVVQRDLQTEWDRWGACIKFAREERPLACHGTRWRAKCTLYGAVQCLPWTKAELRAALEAARETTVVEAALQTTMTKRMTNQTTAMTTGKNVAARNLVVMMMAPLEKTLQEVSMMSPVHCRRGMLASCRNCDTI